MTILEFVMWVAYYYWPFFLVLAFVICMSAKLWYDESQYKRWVKDQRKLKRADKKVL